uniref:G_PROTEIN_RECEP_F1_2 domain-containing protein n=1 Tax=Heterorhabditis bacteriophora TaxID=37862 RepID=A0A1I7W8H0_HETBA
MDNFTVFDDHNNALLLFYNINSPICILLNLLAIYLIVFRSIQEMREYRWHLLHYQVCLENTMTGTIFNYLYIIMCLDV